MFKGNKLITFVFMVESFFESADTIFSKIYHSNSRAQG